MNAWATTIISGLVLVVAFMQWRTAHQKTVMELFERRMKVLTDFTNVVGDYLVSDGNLAGLNARRKLDAVKADARFLFGPEVEEFIDETVLKIEKRDELRRKIRRASPSAIDVLTALSYELQPVETECHIAKLKLSEVMRPYVLMDQKRARTPFDWFHERNRVRLSYADEKQK